MQLLQKDSVFYYISKQKPLSKILAFDLDDTLIKTASGKKFSTGINDWQFYVSNLPEILVDYPQYYLVIFTNQSKFHESNFAEKISLIMKKLGIDMTIFIATGKDKYRKPLRGMWELMKELIFKDMDLDLKKSFYVGDAAGRTKDFACSDRKFALNLGIRFATPELFFHGTKDTLKDASLIGKYEFDPFTFQAIQEPYDVTQFVSKQLELIMFFGLPGCGKSTLSKQISDRYGYQIVSKDLASESTCKRQMEDILKESRSCILDNTNYTKKARATFITIAKKYHCYIHCLVIKCPLELALHLNNTRLLLDPPKFVPMIAYHKLNKGCELPSRDESIDRITELEFHLNFKNDAEKVAFYTYF